MKCLPGQIVCNAIDLITSPTKRLNTFIGDRRITFFKAVRVWLVCKKITRSIQSGTRSTMHAPNLTIEHAVYCLDATNKLVDAVNLTMENVIAHHTDFAKLPVIGIHLPFVPHMDRIVYRVLKKQSQLSKVFGTAVIDKINPEHKALVGPALERLINIYSSFDKAIHVYEKA